MGKGSQLAASTAPRLFRSRPEETHCGEQGCPAPCPLFANAPHQLASGTRDPSPGRALEPSTLVALARSMSCLFPLRTLRISLTSLLGWASALLRGLTRRQAGGAAIRVPSSCHAGLGPSQASRRRHPRGGGTNVASPRESFPLFLFHVNSSIIAR